ncbi:AzlC family ABC transporter permease [Streptococcus panodentis]|uniref:Branched-chain amino acid transporter AzlC n=1 Tax=Streptococcus panodentis TaxID=1581472 RepID=A0ABS5AVP5_9STRE|nr:MULTISPECIES: AzlC family ABC transporter permease [Streptococcus]KXT85451.1 Branched-chain amino acid transport protein azlC [Streptococcus sp. DD11]MBP2620633.1 branched-chain amino acid transporter AzlC [Streptococcus panodentis]
MRGQTFKQGAQAAVPTALGYISIGLACGIMAAPYMNLFEMALMSLLVYAGSAQFAMIGMIALQAPVLAIALTVFLINIRHLLLCLHASTFFRKSSLGENIAIGSLLTDETYGVLMGEQLHTELISASWMQGNNLLSYAAWFLGTVAGTALGGLLPNPESFGLDFALVAMFIGIFSSQFALMLRRVRMNKLFLVLSVVGLAYLLLAMLVQHSLAVLFATLLGCTVGVLLDDK